MIRVMAAGLLALLCAELASAAIPRDAMGWKLTIEKDRMSGDSRLTLSGLGDRSLSPATAGPPVLLIKCSKGSASLILFVGTPTPSEVGRGNYRPMLVKLDDAAPEEVMGDGGQLGAVLSIAYPEGWIKKMAQAKIALVKVTAMGPEAATTAFDVGGLKRYRAVISEHCGVELPP